MVVASMFWTAITNLTYFSLACNFFSLFCCPIICADLRGTAPCRSSLHPPPSATPRAHSALWPHPQRSTRGDVRSLVGCHSKETLHCCWVTSWCSVLTVLIQRTQNGTYLLTILAQSQSQTGWVSPQASRETATTSLNQSSLTLRALIRPVSGKRGGRNTETEATMKAWHEGLQKLRLFLFMQWLMRMITYDANGGPFRFNIMQQLAIQHCISRNSFKTLVNKHWELKILSAR